MCSVKVSSAFLEVLAAVNRREAFQLDHRIINAPTEVNPVQNVDGNRTTLNRDIHFKEIHDVFLDRTISPARTNDESLCSGYRQVAWSPIGLLPNRKCILAAVTADHRVSLYRNGSWIWEEVECVSNRLLSRMRDKGWDTEPAMQVNPEHSHIFSLYKNRTYLMGTVALEWSTLCTNGTDQWAWLITLQRSGHIVVWKVRHVLAAECVTFAAIFDLQLAEPSTLKLHHHCSADGQLLLFAGSHRGNVRCYAFSWTGAGIPTCNPLGSVVSDEDLIRVGAIHVSSHTHGRLIVAAAKNNALVASTINCDANGLENLDQRFVVLPTLQITGLMPLNNGKVICSTEDYQTSEIDLSVSDKGLFTGLEVRSVSVPSNNTMACRGLTGTSDGRILFFLESVRIPYDHLSCRAPTSLLIYIPGDVADVIVELKKAPAMRQSLFALECYKAFCGSSWEVILQLEYEDWDVESDCSLQLLRWFALYKLYACSRERRSSKEVQEKLQAQVERAEITLQLRHVERLFTRLLDHEELTNADLLRLRLACDFVSTYNDYRFDSGLLNRAKKKLPTNPSQWPKELCAICEKPIEFMRSDTSQCPDCHETFRCRATMLACFEDSLTCRWCGAHYHSQSGMENCLLCDGPLN